MSFVAAVRLFVIVAGTMPWPHPASAQDAQNAQATTATTPSASGDNAYQQTLLWKNQDQLVGRLLSADEKLIVWESPQFATPLRIEIPHLTHISFPLEEAASRRTDPFVIATHGQQIVYGELLALDKDQIKIRSGKHGELALKKSEVRSFRRLSNTHALYTGPNSLEDWSTLSPSRQMGQWSTTPEHHVTTKVIGAEMFRDMQLPEISQIDIELRWDRSKPGFVIAFAPPGVTRLAQKTIKLETWDNELVLQILTDSGNFEQLLTITSEMKSLYLRLLWNKQKGEFSVYDQRGRLLGKLVAEDAGGRDLTGLYIQNKGADLTVSHVRVSSWNGQVPHKVEDEISSIQKSDGTTISGKILASESTDRGITVELADGKSEVLMLDEIDSVDFGEAPEPPADPRSLQIDYFDGTLVLGQLVAISDDVAMLQTRFSSDPVRCPLHGARMLKFPEGEAPRVETVGRMELPNVTLHGTLAPVGEEESLGWKPVGAIDASRLSLDKPARIEWGLAREDGTAKIDDGDEDEAAAERREKFTDVLHLRNGDVIPCHLYGINEEEMAVETPFCDVTQIPTSAVKAIELGGNTESITRGFGNEWVVNGDKKQVDRSPNRVVFKGNANLEHELPLNGNEIAFNLKWNASAPALLNLTFKGNPQQQAPNLLIYYLSGQMGIQSRMGNGQFMMRPQGNQMDAKLRLLFSEKNFQVFLNDQQVMSQPTNGIDIQSCGLTMYVQPLNVAVDGNRVKQGNPEDGLLTVSDFTVRRTAGPVNMLDVDSMSSHPLLTIPRSRKHNPPQHVLVGLNGDVLRGQLVLLDEKQVTFKSRMENLIIPRNRLGGVIWFDQPDSESEEFVRPNNVAQITFSSGVTFSIAPERVHDGRLVGAHALFGECAINVADMQALQLGQPPDSTPVLAYSQWKLVSAVEPQFPDPESDDAAMGANSPLIGTKPNDFSVDMLVGPKLRLSQKQGKVLILDFWATWCGPCVASLPKIIEVSREFPDDKVELIAVNQGETNEVIEEFLQTRGWEVAVALDRDGKVGRDFQVQGIPQTVVVGPDGTIKWLHVGAHPKLADELRELLTELTQ